MSKRDVWSVYSGVMNQGIRAETDPVDEVRRGIRPSVSVIIS
jgi:hypothetical protein